MSDAFNFNYRLNFEGFEVSPLRDVTSRPLVWHSPSVQSAGPVLTVRHSDGRDERMQREALLSLIVVGKIAAGSTIRGDHDEAWKPLATWYLDNSEIHALPDIEDTAYVERHVAGVLEPLTLRRGLGFADDADQIAGLTPDVVMNREVTNPAWVQLWNLTPLAARPIVVPTDEIGDKRSFHQAIKVPAWGARYAFHPELEIAIPVWQDPETAVFRAPEFAQQDWRRIAADGAGGRVEPKKTRRAASARRTPRTAPRAAPTGRAAPSAETLRRAPPPPPTSRRNGTLTKEESQALTPAERSEVNKRVRSIVMKRAMSGSQDGRVKLATLRRQAKQDVLSERRSSRRSVSTTPPSPNEPRRTRGHARSPAEARASRESTGANSTKLGRQAEPSAGSKGRVQESVAGVGLLGPSLAAPGMVVETKGWGCLGCFGQAFAMMMLSVFALMFTDVSLRSFVSSDLATTLTSATDDAEDGGAWKRLLSVGPVTSPLVATLAVDISTDEGVRVLRETLATLRPDRRRSELNGARIRLVLLPTGTSDEAEDISAIMVAMHEKGLLFRRLKSLGRRRPTVKRLLHTLSVPQVATVRRLAELSATQQQARAYGRMASGLGMRAPELLLNGVRVHTPGLRSQKKIEEMLEIAMAPTNRFLSHGNVINNAYWRAMLSPLAEPGRTQFYSWFIDRNGVPPQLLKETVKLRPAPRPDPKKATPPAKTRKATKTRSKVPSHQTFAIPAHAPRIGPNSAPVKVVLFADFHCSFSRRIAPNFRKLGKDFGADVQLVFLHYPLKALHPEAQSLARLAAAASRQGYFWQLFDHIYGMKSKLSTPSAMRRWLLKRRGGRKVNAARLRKDKSAAIVAVAKDRALGVKLKLRGTPTTFVNGWRVNGAVPYTKLRAVVERELNKKGSAVKD